MKKIISCIVVLLFLSATSITSFAKSNIKKEAEPISSEKTNDFELKNEVVSAYLCEASTGRVLYAKNENQAASPASVTKIMTLLLVCEALSEGRINLNDTVRISARAASMGGSQVFLEEGERISVEDLIKSTVIASGNDSSVALAELCAGSEDAFVRMMNKRANELGLRNSNFENTTGLDDTTENHYSCAADIAKMSRELIKHKIILEYSSIWQDSIRDGEFTLTNTNRLVRYYDGCNGLKTGSTDKAGYCISATAKRGNMQLIAVIMGAKTRDERNAAARELLDYGFANFALYEHAEAYVEDVDVLRGEVDRVGSYSSRFADVVDKSKLNSISIEYEIPENIQAPIGKGDKIGRVIYKIDNQQIGESDIYVCDDVAKIGFSDIFLRLIKRIICG